MKQKGFSLIELLVAIAIMAVIMAFALPNYLGARERARDTKKKSELRDLKSALRMYYNDHQGYPPTGSCGTAMGSISGCGADGISCCPCTSGTSTFDLATGSTCSTVYMKKFPSNMIFGNNVDYYGVSADKEQFCIKTVLENTSDADLLTSQGQCIPACANTTDASGRAPTITNQSYLVCSD